MRIIHRSLLVILVFIISAQIDATSIVFRAIYPKSPKVESLSLRGSSCGLNWDTGLPMKYDGDGNSWSAEVHCSISELATSKTLEVKAMVDDKIWMVGANHHVDLAQVSGSTMSVNETFYPWFFARSGSLKKLDRVYSKELKNYRDLIVYLPPSFLENTLKPHSNILLMHDGQNLFDPKTSAFGTAWMVQDAADSSIVSGQSAEVMIVGMYNTPDRNNEYTYVYDESEGFGGKGDLYLDWIESTVIPLVSSTDSNLRAVIKRETLGILGSSLGGLISCYAGWTRSNVYGKVGCMSSSFWWADQDFQHNLLPSSTVPAAPRPHIYMDSGTAGSLGGEAQCAVYTGQVYDYAVSASFTENEEIMKYVDVGGQHNEASWGHRVYIPIQFLYPGDSV